MGIGWRSFCRSGGNECNGYPNNYRAPCLSTAGGAYMPGMSDYVIGVKENGMAALAGANLLRAATGEESSIKILEERKFIQKLPD